MLLSLLVFAGVCFGKEYPTMRKYATLGFECRLLVELVVVDIDCRIMICRLRHCWAVVAVLPVRAGRL